MSNFASKPILNGLRFANNNPSTVYNTLPFEDKQDLNSYFQKWQRNDKCTIQLLFDFVPTFDIYTCDDEFVINVPLIAATTGIIGQTFKCYEGEIDFSLLAEGIYYGKLTYTDENGTLQDFRTSPLDVADLHEGTSLIEYRNSRNDKGVIFDTGIVFTLRIETLFDEFQPKAKKEQYEDQKYNAVLLNGIPYRTFTVYFGPAPAIGESTFLPDWLVDKLNVIFTCNEVKIDGTYYTTLDGAELKPTRPGNSYPNDGYWSLEVQSIPNFDLSEYQTGDEPEGDIIVIKKQVTYPNVAASFSVAGVFTDNSNLIRVVIYNFGGDAFTAQFGTSAGGVQIASFDLTGNLKNSLDIGEPFNTATTVYVTFRNPVGTIITGLNLKVIFDYNQYDAPILNPGTLGEFRFPKNFLGHYFEQNDGELEIDWNLATGLGNVGTKYANCAIVGTNGLADLSNKFIKVWSKDEVANFQATGGNNDGQVVLTRDVMPADGIPMFVDNTGISGQYPNANQTVTIASGDGGIMSYGITRSGSGGTAAATIGKSGNLGDGDPLNIEPEFVYLLTFVALTD